MKTAVLVKHRAKPGMRESVRLVWETHVRTRVQRNPDHVAYFYCFDNADADVICAFQVYTTETSPSEFMSGRWYQAYLAEVAPLIVEPPQITRCAVEWSKGLAET